MPLANLFQSFLMYLLLAMSLNSWAIDTYDPATNELKIPFVQVGNRTYTNVVVKVGTILSVENGTPTDSIDVYDSISGVLNTTSVSVGTQTYSNVRITVGPIIKLILAI